MHPGNILIYKFNLYLIAKINKNNRSIYRSKQNAHHQHLLITVGCLWNVSVPHFSEVEELSVTRKGMSFSTDPSRKRLVMLTDRPFYICVRTATLRFKPNQTRTKVILLDWFDLVSTSLFRHIYQMDGQWATDNSST